MSLSRAEILERQREQCARWEDEIWDDDRGDGLGDAKADIEQLLRDADAPDAPRKEPRHG